MSVSVRGRGRYGQGRGRLGRGNNGRSAIQQTEQYDQDREGQDQREQIYMQLIESLPHSLFELLQSIRVQKANKRLSHSESILTFLGMTSRLGIVSVLDKRAEMVSDVPGRIILTRRRAVLSPKDLPICYECNGVVINTQNWRVASFPPKKLWQATNPDSFSRAYADDKYELYEVHDGTMVTFYKWGRDWCISSSNGYDVSTLKWMSGKTFAEVIFDLFRRLYPSSIQSTGMEMLPNGRINFRNLPANYSHTIFFRHHDFHPLESDPERIWHYGSVETNCTFPYNLHFDNPYEFPGIPKRGAKILSRSSRESPLVNLSFEAREMNLSVDQCLNRLFYGYLLIPRDRSMNHILFPSALLTSVRNLMYTKVSFEDKPYVEPAMQKTYNFIKAYLNPLTRNECSNLFPECEKISKRLHSFVEGVADFVVDKSIIDGIIDLAPDDEALQRDILAEANTRVNNYPGLIEIMGKFLYNDMFRRHPRVMMQSTSKTIAEVRNLTKDAAQDIRHAILYIRMLQGTDL